MLVSIIERRMPGSSTLVHADSHSWNKVVKSEAEECINYLFEYAIIGWLNMLVISRPWTSAGLLSPFAVILFLMPLQWVVLILISIIRHLQKLGWSYNCRLGWINLLRISCDVFRDLILDSHQRIVEIHGLRDYVDCSPRIISRSPIGVRRRSSFDSISSFKVRNVVA